MVPFEERKQELAMQLGKERYTKALSEYYDKLLSDARPYMRSVQGAATV